MRNILKVVLILAGSVIIWLGLDIALGGIQTLGWQQSGNFIEIANAQSYAIQDNHTRFVAGVWTALGIFMILGALNLDSLATTLKVFMAMVFIGGLARIASGDATVILSQNILPSLIAELIAFPLLGLWIHKTTRETHDV